MSDFWQMTGDRRPEDIDQSVAPIPTRGSTRKEQITIRLDPGMIADARLIAARKGIGHHTLLRMWVMEGITRAYQDGVLDQPPQSWSLSAGRAAPRSVEHAANDSGMAPPAGVRWKRSGRRTNGG